MTRRVRGAWLATAFAALAVLGGVLVTDTPQCPGSKCQVVAAAPHGVDDSPPVVPTPTVLKNWPIMLSSKR